MPNPFEEHSNHMADYEGMLADPVTGVTSAAGCSITCALFIAGAASVASATYPAIVGHFIVRQALKAGGFSPQLMGQAIVRKNALPAGATFRSGQKLTVAQVGGSIRQCQVEDIEDTFTEWRLNLWDTNEKA